MKSWAVYPEIVFPQFVYVDQQTAVGITEKLHYGADEHGSLDDGLITVGTSTLDQVEVGFTPTRMQDRVRFEMAISNGSCLLFW
ncbi:hypothetical protein [Aggregatibacter actinomycetemcomitans]|uniref:hypothetical protein n=1 Tax=Aggregatibacter actinomycetemcomitans TaxID=714 RepID=UPI0011D72B91|nr:hypothetical protein [Aggregatibacter actinomycetemcomitans]TYA16838.1 hypothetical protein FXE10_02630 [Aggregatibacter actinomycetemcomitans]TYA33556.1 hypothetical protein FXB69_02630 [Aggregatibacter actinomycetemcomitans]TYB02301.1 hypothetical protein FXB93_02545 [Aggregatibacter actinomycetemcomitans]TYB16746.1 hypothetical protein FXB65_02615 [Aggregatibacter actinomycetemcomitans]TYB17737.1 hypothetical protein FXB76_01745 [Aggregatibacter actinomycetemcomitans]